MSHVELRTDATPWTQVLAVMHRLIEAELQRSIGLLSVSAGLPRPTTYRRSTKVAAAVGVVLELYPFISVFFFRNRVGISRDKRAYEPPNCRWSPSPMDTHNPRRVLSTSSASWEGIGCLIIKEMTNILCDDLLPDHVSDIQTSFGSLTDFRNVIGYMRRAAPAPAPIGLERACFSAPSSRCSHLPETLIRLHDK
ncbi:hypothetical protein EVAR_34086_1 [Eumeta japonica]|uniref:Uncharacterized protein n=1 Tax=Eumeta variegata TaxID=151549 RepID=A0A4C1WKC3_EUMVA|nr:hypothetical protein EVAR_34086_1 [Eumeta japonica]